MSFAAPRIVFVRNARHVSDAVLQRVWPLLQDLPRQRVVEVPQFCQHADEIVFAEALVRRRRDIATGPVRSYSGMEGNHGSTN